MREERHLGHGPDPAVTAITAPVEERDGWIILPGDDAVRGSRVLDVCHVPSGSG